MATIRPLDDRVVIKVLDAEDKTAGGIILPDTAKEKPQRGTVEAVGNGRMEGSGERSKMILKKGDTVIFGRYSGTDVELKIMKESDVLARIE